MLTVRDLADIEELRLVVAAGEPGLDREIRWLHVSELPDPTPFLEGGELLLTTGLAVKPRAATQREYVRRLADHGLVGLGFGVGLGYDAVPAPLAREADKLGFPVLCVPYDVPFMALSKAVFTRLASVELERQTRALEVNERLAEAVVDGEGAQALLEIVCRHLGCSLALVDRAGRVLAERHAGKRLGFEAALELAVRAGDEPATLRAARERPFAEYDRLVLHHGQTALAFELARRRAVSAAEIRLAGDLLEDLEQERVDERDATRRLTAFGLDPSATYAALLAVPGGPTVGERLRRSVAEELDRRGLRYLSTVRPDRAAFLVEAAGEAESLAIAEGVAAAVPHARIGVGRPGAGNALGRSLLEARAALDASTGPVASYRDLGSVELLLSLPDAALEAFVDRVLGRTATSVPLVESLSALLESGYRWSEAADELRIHRHTLRYRMERLREQTGRHPDDPGQRMELWLALKARQALQARRASAGPA